MHRALIYFFSGLLASFILYVILQGLPTSLPPADPSKTLKEAEAAYKQGEEAQTVDERKVAFNRALTLYTNLEQQFHPTLGNGRLYFNLANTYYQLEEYPFAIYEYYRSLALAPRDENSLQNLSQALKKLKLTPQNTSTSQLFSLSSFLSLPQRLSLFFWTFVALFALLSLFIWTRKPALKPLIVVAALASLFLLCSLGYSRYFAKQEAVLVHSSTLYRDAGLQYDKITQEPIPAGTKVEVITIVPSGQWLNILTPEGTLGYVPSDAIKLL